MRTPSLQPDTHPKKNVKQDAAAAALYLGLAAVLFRGLWGRMSSVVAADGALHPWEELWHFWWTRRSLAAGQSPFFTDMLGFPDGFNVYRDMSSITMPLLSVPLQWLFGLVPAYNIIAFCSIFTAAFGAYLLCKTVCGRPAAAFVGGLIFGFSQFFRVELSNGMLENVFGLSLLPVIALLLLRMNRVPTAGAGLAAAAAVCWAGLTSWYALFFSGITACLTLAAGLWKRPPAEAGAVLKAYAVMAVTVVAVVAAPLASALGGESGALRGFAVNDAFIGPIKEKICIDILRLIRPMPQPGEGAAAVPGTVQVLPLGVFIGRAAAALALAAFFLRGKKLRFWKAGAVIFLLMTLGPYLNIGGHMARIGDRSVPLPNRLIIALAPQSARLFALHNYRFIAAVLLFVAVLAAAALAAILDRPFSRRLRLGYLAPPLLALFILADVEAGVPDGGRFSAPTAAVKIPDAYDTLDAEAPGAILDIPISTGGSHRPDIRGRQMFYQTRHLRPIWCEPIWKTREAPNEPQLILAAKQLGAGFPWKMPEKAWPDNIRFLQKRGYVFVAVHWDMILPQLHSALKTDIEQQLGPPLNPGSANVAIYRLGAPRPP